MPIRRFDLALDLEAREQRDVIGVALELLLRFRRHEPRHVFLRRGEGRIVVDQHFADVIAQVVTQRTRHGVAFAIHEIGGGAVLGGRVDLVPLALEIVQVPLQLFGGASHTGGAHDGAHAVGDLQLVHDLAHLVAVFALDAARHATGTRVVGHQHQEAAGERDEGGEGGALVAAFFLFDLDDDFLTLGEQVAHVVAPAVRVLAEVVLGDFLQRQEAVALRAVIDEAGLERGLDARDSSFVDVGFLLFLGRDFDGKVVQLLAINQRDAQLLLLSCIDEHSLHLNWTLVSFGPTRCLRRISSRTAVRTTARRGGACREAKDCCGARERSRF